MTPSPFSDSRLQRPATGVPGAARPRALLGWGGVPGALPGVASARLVAGTLAARPLREGLAACGQPSTVGGGRGGGEPFYLDGCGCGGACGRDASCACPGCAARDVRAPSPGPGGTRPVRGELAELPDNLEPPPGWDSPFSARWSLLHGGPVSLPARVDGAGLAPRGLRVAPGRAAEDAPGPGRLRSSVGTARGAKTGVAPTASASRTTSGGSEYAHFGPEYCGNCLDGDSTLQKLIDTCQSLNLNSITVECSARADGSCNCDLECCNDRGKCQSGSCDPEGCAPPERVYDEPLDVDFDATEPSEPADDVSKIEVGARDFPEDLGLFVHLFFIITTSSGVKYALHGAPDGRGCPQGCEWSPLKNYGCLWVKAPSTTNGITRNASDWPPVEVASGARVPERASCIEAFAIGVTAARVPYCASGPNSNSFVGSALRRCDLPEDYPVTGRIPAGFGVDISV